MLKGLLAALLMLAGMRSAVAADAPLDAGQLLQRQQAGQAPLLLDVRSADEYRDGHIAGALNIPVESLARRTGVLGVPRDSEIVVYCVSGKRAARAQETLVSLGYTHVRLLDGSLNTWRQRHLPLAH
ncbi:rhodanese-like domain-containing protein [Dyella kyungheensis]|uniref:Rhodanese-like domain-containing protein n=1 Tax=Dyella kyungheensis TaxID=1242174 RepID=A0ABS2JSM7_9GAMM|nr:rhodanese-like domain-containing protein [Dyella kyungheensis]MBM7121594.1 rhodanese-like domain-containing protein [Dyella kyungheensis]